MLLFLVFCINNAKCWAQIHFFTKFSCLEGYGTTNFDSSSFITNYLEKQNDDSHRKKTNKLTQLYKTEMDSKYTVNEFKRKTFMNSELQYITF